MSLPLFPFFVGEGTGLGEVGGCLDLASVQCGEAEMGDGQDSGRTGRKGAARVALCTFWAKTGGGDPDKCRRWGVSCCPL